MSKRISQDVAITEVAKLLSPNDDLIDTKRTVRNAVQHAERSNQLSRVGTSRNGGPLFVKREFECWAAEKWPVLKDHYQIPTCGSLNAQLPLPTATFIGVPLPGSSCDLTEAYISTSEDLTRTRAELASVRERLEKLEDKTAERSERDADLHLKRVEAGKLGGRSKWGGRPK